MTARVLVLLAVLALVLAPAAAVAQDPFGPIPQAPPEQAPPPPEEEDDDGPLTTLELAAIGLAAAGLITGLAIFIIRDARRRAPVKAGEPAVGEVTAGRHAGSRPPKQQRKQRSRAKGRAARQARKRTR